MDSDYRTRSRMAYKVPTRIGERILNVKRHRLPVRIQLWHGHHVLIARDYVGSRTVYVLAGRGELVIVRCARRRIPLACNAAGRVANPVAEGHHREYEQSRYLDHIDRDAHGR